MLPKRTLTPLGRRRNKLRDGLSVARYDYGFAFLNRAHKLSQAISGIRNVDFHRLSMPIINGHFQQSAERIAIGSFGCTGPGWTTRA
jgi:hypothetical protein